MTDHLYECPDGVNNGSRVVTRDRQDSWGKVCPGSMWCWNHATWEPIPEWWRRKQKELRPRILSGWNGREFDRESQRLAYPISFHQDIVDYCTLTSWRTPDFNSVHEVARFVSDVEDEPWKDIA